jgi:hypothetical protein
MPIIQCATCVHFHPENMLNTTCNAFPEGEGIPWSIILGEHDHRLPFEGDQGIRYEPAPLEIISEEELEGRRRLALIELGLDPDDLVGLEDLEEEDEN